MLIEVNAHSLFSKWFSESGKLARAGPPLALLPRPPPLSHAWHRPASAGVRALCWFQVGKLFEKILELVDDPDVLVFVLIDEVESLSAARRATGSEPSDAIRVVNALLTQLDNLRSRPNCMVLTTSNITGAIDVAFVDRADIKAFIGPPGLLARYGILRSCVLELLSKGAPARRAPRPLPPASPPPQPSAHVPASLKALTCCVGCAPRRRRPRRAGGRAGGRVEGGAHLRAAGAGAPGRGPRGARGALPHHGGARGDARCASAAASPRPQTAPQPRRENGDPAGSGKRDHVM